MGSSLPARDGNWQTQTCSVPYPSGEAGGLESGKMKMSGCYAGRAKQLLEAEIGAETARLSLDRERGHNAGDANGQKRGAGVEWAGWRGV